MERLLEFDKIVGKTIKRITETHINKDYTALWFTDDSYIILTAEHSYGDHPNLIVSDEEWFSLDESWQLELITKEEFEARKQAERKQELEAKEKREREQYERLKRKFEGGS